MPAEILRIATIAFFFSFVLGFVLDRLARRYGFLAKKNTPCVGGIAMGASFLCAVAYGFFRLGKAEFFWPALLGLAVLTLLFGWLDDLKDLSIAAKFSFQTVLAIALICLGVRTRVMFLSEPLNILLSFGWIIWAFNAFNLLDVMDGLAAGTVIIVSLAFLAVSQQGDLHLASLAVALAASTFGFFLLNFPPARIYMGNCGSYFLGFVLAVISILISYASKDKGVALITPLVILGFPFLDTLFLVLMRLWLKKTPFQRSADHICLRFLALGYSKRKTLVLLLGLCLFFAGSGMALVRVDNAWGLGILAVAVAISLGVVRSVVGVKVHES